MSEVFSQLMNRLDRVEVTHPIGRIEKIDAGVVTVQKFPARAAIGDAVFLGDERELGQIVGLNARAASVLPGSGGAGLSVGAEVLHNGPIRIAPDPSWIGRVVDPLGRPLDKRPLFPGAKPYPLTNSPPPAAERRRLGKRLSTGTMCFDTVLPIVRGQRIGLFAGSGVGKSSLLATFAKQMAADIVVLALVGERGRELREFIETTLGEQGMARSVVIAATSDQSAVLRRMCLPAAMTVAEYFRDLGMNVLFLADSVTRFAEAHREIALAAGEPPSLRGYPPSIQSAIMGLAERAGPGREGHGDITAIFTVLVPGSDMDEPIADILRGVLDGHVVMDRKIAERGRYPAIDLLRSVSRSLPWAATAGENEVISSARKLIATWENAEMMVQAGLYQSGSDPAIDRAVQCWPELDHFLSLPAPADGIAGSFSVLSAILGNAQVR